MGRFAWVATSENLRTITQKRNKCLRENSLGKNKYLTKFGYHVFMKVHECKTLSDAVTPNPIAKRKRAGLIQFLTEHQTRPRGYMGASMVRPQTLHLADEGSNPSGSNS